ncbi:MAG TPA: hypothetical protein VFV58_36005 [Blastocatellia bacterium]|jgi:hypothetical protein|nr:hypothetical protein [Blastocatellia bacterium]
MWFSTTAKVDDPNDIHRNLVDRINGGEHWIIAGIPLDHSLIQRLHGEYGPHGRFDTYVVKVCPQQRPTGKEFVIHTVAKDRRDASRRRSINLASK